MEIKGTGDGGGMVGGSRKIKGMLWFSAVLSLFVWMVTKIQTPSEIANTALYMLGIGGLSAIGGQAAVDAVSRWKVGTSESTSVTKEVKVTETPSRRRSNDS